MVAQEPKGKCKDTRVGGRRVPQTCIDLLTGRFFPFLLLITILFITTTGWAQNGQSVDGYDQLNPEGLKQLDEITAALRQVGKWSVRIGLGALVLLVLRKLAPMSWLDAIDDRRLAKAVREVDDLLKRIREDAEAASAEAEPEEEVMEEGILAGLMAEAELAGGVDVPSYVLTVNDLMLDNIMNALSHLRRLRMPKAELYREYMFTVLEGIKVITEQCETTGAASSLAINARDYFKDDQRSHDWKHVLGLYAKKRGDYQEAAQVFLLFMKNLRENKRLAVVSEQPTVTLEMGIPEPVPDRTPAVNEPEIPELLLEETLPLVQKAAKEEAERLISLVKSDRSSRNSQAWQFEFVRRQQQLNLKEDARKMLRIFLQHERKALTAITKTKMLPCKTWDHILYMLGVKDVTQLQARIEKKLLTGPEIVILEKAFLQTFAKPKALLRVYGQDSNARVLMDIHLPQIRSESLGVLRRIQKNGGVALEQATKRLDKEETPKGHEVARLIKHFVYNGHPVPGAASTGERDTPSESTS